MIITNNRLGFWGRRTAPGQPVRPAARGSGSFFRSGRNVYDAAIFRQQEYARQQYLAAARKKAAVEEAAAPAIAVAYLEQQLSAGIPLTAEQFNHLVAALKKLPLPQIVAVIRKQQSRAPYGTPPDQLGGLGKWGGWKKLSNAGQRVVAAPITIVAPHSKAAGMVSQEAQAKAFTFTSVRDTVQAKLAMPITIFAPHSKFAGMVSQGAQKKAITMMALRDATQAVVSVVANYWVPGISVVLAKYVVSKGAADLLNSDVGKVAQIVGSAAGAARLIATHGAQLATAQKGLTSAANYANTAAKGVKAAGMVAALTRGKQSAPSAPGYATQDVVPQDVPQNVPVQKSASLFLPITGALALLNFL